MKALKKHIGKFSLLMAMLFLVQSCKVYHKDSVTLQQAVESGKQIKIETNLDQTFRYKKIVFEDGHYYGILKHKGQFSQFPIDENSVLKVRLHNKTLSNIYSIAFPIAAVIGTVTAILFLEYKKSQEALLNIFNTD